MRVGRRAGGLLPSQEESDVERGAVQVDKLEEEHLEREAVLPLGLGPRVLCVCVGGGGTGRRRSVSANHLGGRAEWKCGGSPRLVSR